MTQMDGHLVTPKAGTGGGVLIIHPWWGLNAFFRDLCQRFADEGFVALAVDLYGGKVATSISEAKRLRAAVTASRKEPAYKYLTRMIYFLSSHWFFERDRTDVFNPEASELAWERTIDFLKGALKLEKSSRRRDKSRR